MKQLSPEVGCSYDLPTPHNIENFHVDGPCFTSTARGRVDPSDARRLGSDTAVSTDSQPMCIIGYCVTISRMAV